MILRRGSRVDSPTTAPNPQCFLPKTTVTKRNRTLREQEVHRIREERDRNRRQRPVLTSERLRSGYLASDDVLIRSLLEGTALRKPIAASPRRGEVAKAASEETGYIVEERLGLPALNRTLKHQLSLSAEGPDVPAMVMGLLPRSTPRDIREELSNALAYVARDRAFVHDSWPLTYGGLSNLGSAIVHIHRIARFMGQSVDWLLAIWEREVTRVETRAAKNVLEAITESATCGDVRSAIKNAIADIREILPKNVFAADRIEPWLNLMPESEADTLLETVLIDGTTGKRLTPTMKKRLRQDISSRRQPETVWRAVSPSADGTAAYEYHDLIRSFHRSLVAQRDSRVLHLCQKLAKSKPHSAMSPAYIARTIRVKRHEADTLGQIMTETYSPSLQRLSIQLRVIVTRKSRTELQTNGLCERLLIHDQRYKLALAFLEPSGSSGPTHSVPDDSMQIVADSKTVSMRFDVPDEGHSSTNSRKKPNDGRVILSIAEPPAKKTVGPSAREVDMIGLMWGLDGTHRQREDLLNHCQVPKSTRAYTRERILRERMMSRMYHPRLEYAGVPDGLLIAVRTMKARDRDWFRNWLLDTAAYVELLENHPDSGTCDLVATVRVPRDVLSELRSTAPGKLASLGLESEDYVVCRIEHQSTYRLSALGRIFDDRTCKWIDPWFKRKA